MVTIPERILGGFSAGITGFGRMLLLGVRSGSATHVRAAGAMAGTHYPVGA